MMVRYALALLAAPVMLAAIPAQIAHAQQKADDLKQVSAYIRAVKTMTADFTQTDRNGRTLSGRSEEHTSELQSLMRISYAVFCLKKKTTQHSKKTKEKQQHPNTKK